MVNPLSLSLQQLVADAMSDPEWSYDPRTGRYRGPNGRFISRASMMRIIDTRIGSLQAQAEGLANKLISGELTLPEWERQFAQTLKNLHVQTFIAGAGGVDRLVPADYLTVARTLKGEYGFLADFARDVALGRVTEGQLRARMGMYLSKARASYWGGMEVVARRRGLTHMRRILADDAEHCPECPQYAAAGVVPIGQLPLPTQRCTCKSNCRCSVEYTKDPNA